MGARESHDSFTPTFRVKARLQLELELELDGLKSSTTMAPMLIISCLCSMPPTELPS